MRERPPFPVQFYDLLLMELTNWRWSWRSMLLLGTVAPLGSMAALSVFGRAAGPEAMAYILTGNIVLSLMFENLDKVQSHFSFMRFRGTLDFLATLPIDKAAVILAVMASFFLLSLPSLVITVLLGALLLNVPIDISPVILLVAPVTAIPMAGIGALIGTSARTPPEAGSLSTLITLVMLGLGPVIIPPDRLPVISIVLGRFSPATYAASALRQALLGPVTPSLLGDLGFLIAFGLLVFWLVGRRMDWRQR